MIERLKQITDILREESCGGAILGASFEESLQENTNRPITTYVVIVGRETCVGGNKLDHYQ